jgi:hypothetical protein
MNNSQELYGKLRIIATLVPPRKSFLGVGVTILVILQGLFKSATPQTHRINIIISEVAARIVTFLTILTHQIIIRKTFPTELVRAVFACDRVSQFPQQRTQTYMSYENSLLP